ncbi:DUF1553 domain-containing protein [Roseiconus nitratireducens]|uniref:DUF1553 domain-containing protein n=1 Tax=Roseiconus nitratireducens TaxID=2605748 RepID=UPI001376134B|nr:DUF1553 domain-containing protein [Roseiconus nitratireducens]
MAIKLNGGGGRIEIDPADCETSLKFTGGDAITIAAWIAPRRIGGSSPRYVIGKGRTGNKGFRRDNQNWALRITPVGDRYQVSFLFATANGEAQVRWHRWTTQESLQAGDGWHHVAVAYRFGEPTSVRGWIDGAPCSGTWDMAGPTNEDPIVDDDAVWIGSALGGSAGNSFAGAIDSVSVQRRMREDAEIKLLYRRDESVPRTPVGGKPEMPEIAGVPAGKVLHQFYDGLPVVDQWPDQEFLDQLPPPDPQIAVWQGDSFLLPRVPMRYDAWGIRSAWKSPGLLRMAADVELPTGANRVLLRARSLGRLWINGELVASTKLQTRQAPSGEEPVAPLAQPPHPGVRVKGYGQQEVIADHEIKGAGSTKVCRVVLELIVGGNQRRTETGEVCVAIETADGESFNILLPVEGRHQSLALRDAIVGPELDRIDAEMSSWETSLRRNLAADHDDYWDQRHQAAKGWADEHPAPSVPSPASLSDSTVGESDTHPVDAFVLHRMSQARQSLDDQDPLSESTVVLAQRAQQLLKTHCVRCHGNAEKGGLRLDSRQDALEGGESGWAAIVPGEPDESELMLRLLTDDPSTSMPPGDDAHLSKEEIELLSDWIRAQAPWPRDSIDRQALHPTELIDDAAFLRRVSFDTVGVPPTEQEARSFLADPEPDKRKKLVDRLLQDDRVADQWVSDWLDLLAENPTLLNTSLNSTGPFRWFLHDSLVDQKPIDRMVTELVMMRGDRHTGGSAGFGMAGENDAPMAAKAHVLASGLLGIELQCARCHDSPYHSTTQEDLFSLAAMLNRKPLGVPSTSRVPDAFFEMQEREPLIEVTLDPGVRVEPAWTLARFTGTSNDASIDRLVRNSEDSRERLAALITAPSNRRFAAVIVNRVWTRLIGRGLVESLHDWEHVSPSHPELLQWLSHDFVASGYDIRHLLRTILTSDLYARTALDPATRDDTARRFFAGPTQRRLTGEQIVDAMHSATGRSMDCEELTFVHDGRRPLANRLTLGTPSRAWMLATLNNERDRPSLSLPKARAIVDVLHAFAWNGSRQKPVHQRETEANVLQPGILANGVLTMSLSRAAVDSPLADLAVSADNAEAIVDSLYLRFLTRLPQESERQFFAGQLREGFDDRIVPADQLETVADLPELPLVHWFNHLRPDANEIQQERERRVREGPPPDPRLQPDWRGRYEDVVWSLINHDEFVWMP